MWRLIKLFVYTTCIYIGFCGAGQSGRVFADTIDIHWLNEDYTIYDTTSCAVGGNLSLPTAPTKRGYTFTGWEKFFTPIEYLESSGTQYVYTKFSPNQDTRVVAKFMAPSNDYKAFIFGARYGVGNRSFAFLYAGNGQMRYDYSYGSTYGPANIYGQKMTVDSNKNECNVYNESGTTIWSLSVTYSIFQTPNNLFFPGIMTDGTYSGVSAAIRMYSLKIYDNNVLVRDFIPVLDSNGVACMFDKVSGQFFYNSGTGDFIAGPEITE